MRQAQPEREGIGKGFCVGLGHGTGKAGVFSVQYSVFRPSEVGFTLHGPKVTDLSSVCFANWIAKIELTAAVFLRRVSGNTCMVEGIRQRLR